MRKIYSLILISGCGPSGVWVKEGASQNDYYNEANDCENWARASANAKYPLYPALEHTVVNGKYVQRWVQQRSSFGDYPYNQYFSKLEKECIKEKGWKWVKKGPKLEKKIEITPLFKASYNGHLETVKSLLATKADVNATNNNGATTLFAASQKGHVEIVKLLLAAKAKVNATRNDGATPLLIASYNGHFGTVKLLLAAKAKVNSANNDGDTPISVASKKGHDKIVKLLMANQR